MANLYDYILWRGDLSFSQAKFCEVDGIIFSMLSYLDFDNIGGGEGISLRDAARDYCAEGNYESVEMGLILPSPNINRLFCTAASTERYARVYVTDYVAESGEGEAHQFSAATFHLDTGHLVVAFRGTDDTIVGWKENCCLAFMDEIPAQRMAVEYLNLVANKYPDRRIYVTGHSKGGNLTLYAALKCDERVGRRILRAYCNDGPGLSRSMIASSRYALMESRFTVLLPQSSYIGILFEKGEKYTVVKSLGVGPFQHDPFSWVLNGPHFEVMPELSEAAKKNEDQFRRNLDGMTPAEKRILVEGVFKLLSSTGAKTLSELNDGRLSKLLALAKVYGRVDKDDRELMVSLFLRLIEKTQKNTGSN